MGIPLLTYSVGERMLKKAINNLVLAHAKLFYATAETPDKHKVLHNHLAKLDKDIRKLIKLYHTEERKHYESRL